MTKPIDILVYSVRTVFRNPQYSFVIPFVVKIRL